MDLREWQNRLNIVIVIAGLLGLTIVGRLYQKAVLDHVEMAKAAASQYQFTQNVTGDRGAIVVKDNGTYYPLATNERRYQVLVVPHNVKNPQTVANALSPIIGMSSVDIFSQINNKKWYVPPIAHKITSDQADKIAALNMSGVLLEPEEIRTYPEGNLGAQVLGFVNASGAGNYGVEQAFNAVLRGQSGVAIGQQTGNGQTLSLGTSLAAQNGATVILTINREIQYEATQQLAQAIKDYKADSGSLIIMNPKTGAIVAMASEPDYDPNTYNTVPTDQQSVFLDSPVVSAWEPGSIMKPIIMAIAIDHGDVQPDTSSTFGASVQVLGHAIWTAEKKAFGTETMTQVLENSDNVGMVWVSNKLGNETMFDGLKKFLFDTAPDFQIDSPTSGSMPPLKSWNDLSRATISFGQGISVSLLQMAMAYSTLANQGVMMQPYIVQQVIDANGKALINQNPKSLGQIVSADTAGKVTSMLESVVTNGLGKHAGVPGYRVGGKTGTAQVPDPSGGYYPDKTIGSFAGYFPLSNPQYTMILKIDNPKTVNFAESSAAPTFGKIASWILNYEQVPPDKPTKG